MKRRQCQQNPIITYHLACMLALQRVVQEAAVQDRDQCMALDVARKGKVSVRLFDMPLLLEFGRRLSVICGGEG